MTELPLFPLQTVLFPGGLLPLRIFEPRYVDMVSRCLRDEGSFGVVLILDGAEVGAVGELAGVGCSAFHGTMVLSRSRITPRIPSARSTRGSTSSITRAYR